MFPRLIRSYVAAVSALKDLSPLFLRLILAYGFAGPAYLKITHFSDTIGFFDSLGIPLPELNAYLATATEVVGTTLILLGLATRFSAIPMIVVMLVAIKTVHLAHGFSCGQNGFEIPFYFLIMLFSLIVTGAGRFSLDRLLEKRFDNNIRRV